MVCNNVAIVKAVVSERGGDGREKCWQSVLPDAAWNEQLSSPFPPLASVYLPTQERGKDCAVTESERLFSHCTAVRTSFMDA